MPHSQEEREPMAGKAEVVQQRYAQAFPRWQAGRSIRELPAGALRDSCGGFDKNEEIIWTDWKFVPGTVSSANS
jgi:hypothetical protein